MNALFIGGSNDGEWIKVGPHALIKIPTKNQSSPTVEFEAYRSEIIRAGNNEFAFYVFAGMPIEDAILRLIQNYRPEK